MTGEFAMKVFNLIWIIYTSLSTTIQGYVNIVTVGTCFIMINSSACRNPSDLRMYIIHLIISLETIS